MVQLLIEKEEAYIPIIELLIICFKDSGERDFLALYNCALLALANALTKEARNPEIKLQFCLGGIVSLMMLAIERESLE